MSAHAQGLVLLGFMVAAPSLFVVAAAWCALNVGKGRFYDWNH